MNNIVIVKSSKDDRTITYINIDLLLKKLAFERLCEFNFDVSLFFSKQFQVLISFSTLMSKIKNLFNFYTKNMCIITLKIVFPRGIILFLNTVIKFNNCILSSEDLTELKEFYKKIKNFPEASESGIAIKEMNDLINFLIQITLLQIKPAVYQNFLEQLGKARNPLIPEKISKYFDVTEWSESEFAKQLTLYTDYFFKKIEPKELLSSNWTKKDKFLLSPNVMRMIDRFNKICNWVCEEILSYDHKTNRVRAISKFIKIANFCQMINNFNDCVNIITALNNLSIKSLKKTWTILLKNPEISNMFKELNFLCSYTKNYENIRNEISMVKGQPCIPYLGLYLKELAFLDEGPKYINANNLINLEKLQKVGEKIEEIKEFQSNYYVFVPVTKLSFLADPKPKKEETLLQISSKLGKLAK